MQQLPGIFRLLLLSAFLAIATSTSDIVTTLPGYSGDLPFTLETGYIGVGENETAQLFYYFVESQRNPALDPVLIWISGGRGCSALVSFFFASGPLTFKLGDYNGSLPTLRDNTWAWTQGLNIIYLDAPVGAGFSYSETDNGYIMDDYVHMAQVYEFLQKWLNGHPRFQENQLYVGSESYSGLIVPMIVQQIITDSKAGSLPVINLKGYVLGNPLTDSFIDTNAKIPYAHRLTLISNELYESAETNCNGNYVNVDSDNYNCSSDIDAINKLISDINVENILEPNCPGGSPEQNEDVELVRRYLSEKSSSAFWCRSYNHMLASLWANDKGVQEVLGVREGTKTSWQFCNTTLDYNQTVTSVLEYHQNLTSADIRVLIYSGDHDMLVPNIGTQEWINLLNLSVDESWRTWSVHGQTAGLPTLHDNPWAWTQGLNIIYLDAPVGAGFSYSKSYDGYIMDDYKYVAQVYEFLQKWLTEHPQLLKNQLYISGESYGGMHVPMIAQQIVIGNEAGSVPMINLKGYVIGGAVTDSFTDTNAKIPYAHRLTLISDQLYESAKASCNGNYVNVDSDNYQCSSDIDAIDKLIGDINTLNILEPNCVSVSPEPNEDIELVQRYLSEKSSPALWCRSYNHMLCNVWANNKGVQEALGVREGTKTFWQYCNTTLEYTHTVTNVVGYHRNLTNADLRVLIYSGDHDMSVPNIGTQEWIRSLNLTTDESWRGGGHFAAENMVKECAAMIDRWMAYFPL
ncbi:hypothetical protein FH972_020729 [Carpinus fangiana]|uniref:Carboxypeptidase n=1 Tax=Carpinus fangiana TaxID=176857 RepID=A0A5N6RXA8_9ROSI|nr:hypothetical protein FH972_020729 [Carpinus fangiana]